MRRLKLVLVAELGLDYVILKLETYAEEHRDSLLPAWVPRMLLRGHVAPGDIFNS